MAVATVNDIHSELNETVVEEVVALDSLDSIQAAVRSAAEAGTALAIAGGRHAMGGQQFCAGGRLLDTRGLDQVLDFDRERGTIEVEAGLQWPGLIEWLTTEQQAGRQQWGIAQKQTGADRLSLGGAVSANVHGRGLTLPPIVADVESLVLVDAAGESITCSRTENPELFRLAIGGYGLFGCVYSVKLRLVQRRVLQRVVEIGSLDKLITLFDRRIADGFLYGDFQFAIDPASDDFLRRGVFSCYRPVDGGEAPPAGQRALSTDDWQNLIYLAHTDKARAWELYSTHYVATSGQLYYSDAHQFADYSDAYHRALDVRLGATDAATERTPPRSATPRPCDRRAGASPGPPTWSAGGSARPCCARWRSSAAAGSQATGPPPGSRSPRTGGARGRSPGGNA